MSTDVAGLWYASHGKDMTIKIRRVSNLNGGDVFEIDNPSIGLQFVDVADFPKTNGKFHYFGFEGELRDNVLVWNNGTKWSKKSIREANGISTGWLDAKRAPPKTLVEASRCTDEMCQVIQDLYSLAQVRKSPHCHGSSNGQGLKFMAEHGKTIACVNDRLTQTFEAVDSLEPGAERKRLLGRLTTLEKDINALQSWARRDDDRTPSAGAASSGASSSGASQWVSQNFLPLSSNDGWCGKTVRSWVIGDQQEDVAEGLNRLEQDNRKSKRARGALDYIEDKIGSASTQLREVGTCLRMAFAAGFAPAGYQLVNDQHALLREGRRALDAALTELDGLVDASVRERKRKLSKQIDFWLKQCDDLDDHLKRLPQLFKLLEL
eukprot:gnl/MRDRNA2_/MRDRNA2_36521_c0_seq1.p1 gnl/MRDRNA2_/MRDRNA2_36521_c0~~gnl/MRDRNA2_/MRDRNA2_36521_c0_seq1.p1  ORF type:complete len:378 (+),score=82.71 gnl/MRDRNA2_/MRDRNA2_36521_c0_seq1:177-1310(+)